MSESPRIPTSPQSAMRKQKEEPALPPSDPSAPQKIGTFPLSAFGTWCTDGCLCVAILSVFDKTGLLDLAKNLTKRNVKLYGSGGTAAMVREAGFPIRYVDFICRMGKLISAM